MSFGRLVERLLAIMRSSGSTRTGMPSIRCSLAREYSELKSSSPCAVRTTSIRSRPSPPIPGGCKPKAAIQNPPASAAAWRTASSPGCSSHRSRSCVLTGAPCSTAAPRPMTRYRTSRWFSAVSRARSADVSAKSSTSQSGSKALGWRQLEAAQGVIEIRDVGFRMPLRNCMCAPPEVLGTQCPLLLIGRQPFRKIGWPERGLGRSRHQADHTAARTPEPLILATTRDLIAWCPPRSLRNPLRARSRRHGRGLSRARCAARTRCRD